MVVSGHTVWLEARDAQLGAVFGLAGHYPLCRVADASLGAVLGLAGHSPQMTSIFRVFPPFRSVVSCTDLCMSA
jgi:hypothetical protein